jgi:hypothetical protein
MSENNSTAMMFSLAIIAAILLAVVSEHLFRIW